MSGGNGKDDPMNFKGCDTCSLPLEVSYVNSTALRAQAEAVAAIAAVREEAEKTRALIETQGAAIAEILRTINALIERLDHERQGEHT